MAKTPDMVVTEKDTCARVTALLKDYLQFYTRLNLLLDRDLDRDIIRYYFKEGSSRIDNRNDFRTILDVYRVINSYAKTRSWITDSSAAFEVPKKFLSVLELEKKILVDKKFMDSREGIKTDITHPLADNEIGTAVMESFGDANLQAQAVNGLAEQIHHHVRSINALRTQATSLGLTPQVDELVATLNRSARSR